jgi:hypothetical protein
MPRHRGLYRSQWRACDRCGFMNPLSHLMMQKGMLLDAKCIDSLDVELRPKVIAEVLSDTEETRNEAEQVYDDPQTIEFLWFILILLHVVAVGVVSAVAL